MEESILTSIKKLVGMDSDYGPFDTDLIIFINSVFSTLAQLGVGINSGFSIEDEEDVWSDFIEDPIQLGFVKTYIYLKVRLIFDPPNNSTIVKAYEEQIKELESRLNIAAETT